ncbi:MAG: homocitrate synthase [Dehalococcoidia bacterium]
MSQKEGKIYIIDVTNRDGAQTAKLSLSKLEKTMINLYLNGMGIYQSEAGFTTTHHESRYLQANSRLVEMGVLSPIRISGWARATARDVEDSFALAPSIRHLNLSAPVSDQMIEGKLKGKSRDGVISMMVEGVRAARSTGAESIGVNAEDASRADQGYLLDFTLAAREHGADRLRYCDTLGYENPFTIYEATRNLAEKSAMPIEIHCHGDLGMAVANSLAGARGVIDGGQDAYINTTINGIGERAGNADLVSVVLAVTKSRDFSSQYRMGSQIDLSMAWKVARFVSYAFDVPIPANQPGVGTNAFTHASGIHADAVLKDPTNYELYDLTEIGRGDPEVRSTGREICTGEYGGINSLRHLLGRIMGDDMPDCEQAGYLETIMELIAYANVEAQKPLTDDEINFIAEYPEVALQLLTLKPPEISG